jgi:hypothetical protein
MQYCTHVRKNARHDNFVFIIILSRPRVLRRHAAAFGIEMICCKGN